jgi:hypothetical protein
MTVYSKQSYNDQDNGRILKASRKQQYIMCTVPIAFLNNELKAELGMKKKKEKAQGPDGSWIQGIQDVPGQDSEVWRGVASIIPEMVNDTQWADEEPWVKWQLWNGDELGPGNAGGMQIRSILDVNDASLDMNVFDKLMEGKHKGILINNFDDSMSIENANNLFHFGQNNSTDKSCLDNNYNNYHDEFAYPFNKRIKLKHELEAAQENKPV